ncbi:hypothetical protein ABGB14_37255 [Nonomuraea sp. B10E15]|uniref:hypothetical protein n=1 Tax=Nonomuraea sp. B10E15 TaxID=3153560 RepID=UPI00325EE890
MSSCGQGLSFSSPPERVITLDHSSTETLLALGPQDRMAGTSNLKTTVAPQYKAAYDSVPVARGRRSAGPTSSSSTPRWNAST